MVFPAVCRAPSGASAALPVAVGAPCCLCRPAPEGLRPLGNVRQTTRRGRVGNVSTGVRQGYLPLDALDLAEEMPFCGEEEGTFVLLSPFPALVLGFLPLQPGHGVSSSGSPPWWWSPLWSTPAS